MILRKNIITFNVKFKNLKYLVLSPLLELVVLSVLQQGPLFPVHLVPPLSPSGLPVLRAAPEHLPTDLAPLVAPSLHVSRTGREVLLAL